MIAGRLKYQLLLLRPIIEDNDFGEGQMAYIPVKPIRAERVKISGNRSDEVGEHFADYRAEFNIRSAHKVADGWRVKDLTTGYTYTITNIIPNKDRGMLTLVCERVNE